VAWATNNESGCHRQTPSRGSITKGKRDVSKWPCCYIYLAESENWPVEQISANVVDILGYKAEEFLNGSVLYAECIHPDDFERVTKEVTTHSESDDNSFTHSPYRLISRSGDTVWVLDTTSIVRDSIGGITHYLGYLVDISEQKKTGTAFT